MDGAYYRHHIIIQYALETFQYYLYQGNAFPSKAKLPERSQIMTEKTKLKTVGLSRKEEFEFYIKKPKNGKRGPKLKSEAVVFHFSNTFARGDENVKGEINLTYTSDSLRSVQGYLFVTDKQKFLKCMEDYFTNVVEHIVVNYSDKLDER